MPGRRKYTRIEDRNIRAAVDFFADAGGHVILMWDNQVRGLVCRVGKNRVSWTYYAEQRTHGKRSTIARRLGFFPVMSTAQARKAALKLAGDLASDRLEPGRRAALKVADACARYVEHLAEHGKSATWSRTAAGIVANHIVPEFGRWPLQELSKLPGRVRDWHRKLTRTSGPVAANKAARLLNSAYEWAQRSDRTLPPQSPTSDVVFNKETRSQVALDFADFPTWYQEVIRLPPIRRAFQLVNLYTGARPGELARLKWSDIDCKARTITIRAAKAGADIVVPMSSPIALALKIARNESQWVFPAAFGDSHIKKFDGPPIWGMGLRRTFRSVAADLGVDEVHIHLLLGHALVGVSRGYVARLLVLSGPGLRASQRRISVRISSLLLASRA